MGTTIHYHEMGEGYPIIFLHSFGPGTTAWVTWYKVLAEFAKHFRCIAMDLPNFAKTGPVEQDENIHSFQAKTALALMDALGIQKAHVVGNSQGGQSAMSFAYHYPDRISKLVWGAGHVGTMGGYPNEYLISNYPEEGVMAAIEVMREPTHDNFRRYLRSMLFDPNLVMDELINYLMSMHTGRPDLVEARERIFTRPMPHDHSREMMTISCPTLIVWGRNDRTCTFEIGINALNLTPNATLVVLKNTGHWVPFERPEEYTRQVLAFLRDDEQLAVVHNETAQAGATR
jgi:pimeloyl-ACP methyl ester carboxylesterase